MLKSMCGMCALGLCASLSIGCATLAQNPTATGAQPVPTDRHRSPAPSYHAEAAPQWFIRPPPAQLALNADRGPAGSRIHLRVEPLAQRSLWNRLRGGFALPESDSERVQRELNWYVSHPDYMLRVVARAQPYLHFIAEEIETRGLPAELALLPIVESAFNVFAYSPGRAAGVWQFIPATGRRYGLRQNWWYDGRRDVYAATHAALDYLQALQERFDGDWLHALGAYNAGEGNISRAIRSNRKRGKPIDFWHLRVPRETHSYVPKLLALSRIIRDPGAHGIELPYVADTPVFAKVSTQGQLDLAVAAELAGISIQQLYMLNPGYNRWATAPDGPHYLLLPLANVARFQQRLQALPPTQRVSWQRHRIKPGESLSHIAERYRTTVVHLRTINKLSNDLIRSGRYLLVPHSARQSDAYALSAVQRTKRVQAKVHPGERLVHHVDSGDTLWELAGAYGISTAKIAQWNGLSVRDVIRPGQKLVLWVSSGEVPPVTSSRISLPADQAVQRINYVVRQGDSLSRIASRFRVSVGDLRRWNESRLRGKYLQPGQQLRVYIDVRRQSG
ncbi:MAG: LysM peptidoglycan-binding domain-containing protein [Gammaproteobacteria bacterium]|nr:LysM peptidoglycan-binding domain-containing protein [Gammaproteobacteria bacterium]